MINPMNKLLIFKLQFKKQQKTKALQKSTDINFRNTIINQINKLNEEIQRETKNYEYSHTKNSSKN